MLPGAGCAGSGSSVAPRPELQRHSQVLPTICREHVHIYMINGLTILPHMCGSMNRMAPCVEELGFCKPKVASHYWRWSYQDDIRRIHQEDPDARFVLVGYSVGGGVVHSMAKTLEKDGIYIDLVVYIDPHSLTHDISTRPANVGKIVSINSTAWMLAGKCHCGEECHKVNTLFHLATPRQQKTLDVLSDELLKLADACGPVPPHQSSH
jgi:hypothetical protein